jgi:hypothetical protein
MQSNILKYVCPVCGFLLDYPAKDFNICPSCGVEFDADTVEYSINELRLAWMNRGMEWSSGVIPRPLKYDPVVQLRNLDVSRVSSSMSQALFGVRDSTQTEYRIGPSSVTAGSLRYRIA